VVVPPVVVPPVVPVVVPLLVPAVLLPVVPPVPVLLAVPLPVVVLPLLVPPLLPLPPDDDPLVVPLGELPLELEPQAAMASAVAHVTRNIGLPAPWNLVMEALLSVQGPRREERVTLINFRCWCSPAPALGRVGT
jgi:hypothetical protein